MPDDERHGLTELADLAGVTPRTVRYYLAQGLLPAPGLGDPTVRYGPGHLARLRVIRRLQADHLPLAEIRRRLSPLGDDEVIALADMTPPAPPADSAMEYLKNVLGAPSPRPSALIRAPGRLPLRPTSAAHAGTPVDLERSNPVSGPTDATPVTVLPELAPIERSQWDRIVLGPDVELNLRRPLGRSQQKQVDRLVAIARELLEEDRS